MQLDFMGEEIGRDPIARKGSFGGVVENIDSSPGSSTYLGHLCYPEFPHLYSRRVWLDMF